jgi:hypothetical protein
MVAIVRSEVRGAMKWLVAEWQWPMAALFAGVLLLSMAPIWGVVAGSAIALVWLQLPIYMVHQFEEHYGDRFRLYVNRNVAHCDALTPEGAFWINSLGVWGVDLAMLYLAVFVSPALALAAFYLPIVNGIAHLRETAVRRRYNPGLWTSLILFLPVGGYGLYRVSVEAGASVRDHALGLGIAVAVHAAIIVYLLLRIRKLRGSLATAG